MSFTDRARCPAIGEDAGHAWVAAGARLVGGCCRVGPERIAELARAFAAT